MQQLPQLHKSTVDFLKKNKNLLAFSAGVDSSALFFILKSLGIEFDLAIVDYNTRVQSKDEVRYAKELSNSYKKKLFLHTCKLESANFEHNARQERYGFFTKVIKENGYTNLLTAHHLNDKLEWFLMQLGKGSGLVEMIGMSEIEKREDFNIVRPLLHVSKKSLKNFLLANDIRYFIDESNSDFKYTRNQIREKYSNSFIKDFESGLVKSFEYLDADINLILPKKELRIKNLFVIKRDKEDLKNIRQIDKIVKKLGALLSASARTEITRTKDCVISGKIAIVFEKDFIFISPFIKANMPKYFKESCRLNQIPTKVRPYLHSERFDIISLRHEVQKLLS